VISGVQLFIAMNVQPAWQKAPNTEEYFSGVDG
jgi:hypothetical protein